MKKGDKADAAPQDDKETFEDLVGKDQSASKPADTPAKGEQSDQKPDADGKTPADQSGETPAGEAGDSEDKTPKEGEESEDATAKQKKAEGDKSFWGKFRTEDDAKKSYDEAQGKIIDQGKEINNLKKTVEENEGFLNTLDKALLKNPELANQLKSAIAEEMKGGKKGEEPEGDTREGDEDDLDAKIERKIEERENKAKIKKERDEWIEKHPDFKNPEIGHKVLDLLENEGLPFTAKTLDIAYNYVTKDQQKKKAKDEAVKKEEVADLERQEASAVGGGEPSPKGKTPQENPFDDLVGDSINPNIVRR